VCVDPPHVLLMMTVMLWPRTGRTGSKQIRRFYFF